MEMFKHILFFERIILNTEEGLCSFILKGRQPDFKSHIVTKPILAIKLNTNFILCLKIIQLREDVR